MERVEAWAETRSPAVIATVGAVVLVMAYSLFAHSVLHGGNPALASPSDLWSLAGSSAAILHGHFSQIYVHNGALTSPPALEVALAPVMGLGQLVGLSPHLRTGGEPLSMWLVLGPAAVAMASTALFAIDAVARHWRFSGRQRLALALVSAVGVANVVGMWGHPEDCVALAMVMWAALAMERDGTSAAPRAALLLGLGIAFQPLAVLGVVPVLARVDWHDLPRLAWRLVVFPLALLVPPLLAEPNRTMFVIVKQPFQPHYVSFTPLTHLAPVIASGVDGGGPTRLVATVLAAGLALFVCRRRHDLATVLMMTTLAFLFRIVLETELNWYYLWPIPALCLPLALRRGYPRFAVCSVALVLSIVLGNHNHVHHIARWWPALMLTLVVMVLAAGPSPRRVVELLPFRRTPEAGPHRRVRGHGPRAFAPE